MLDLSLEETGLEEVLDICIEQFGDSPIEIWRDVLRFVTDPDLLLDLS